MSNGEAEGDGEASGDACETVGGVVVVGQKMGDGCSCSIALLERLASDEYVPHEVGGREHDVEGRGGESRYRVVNSLPSGSVGGGAEEKGRGILVVECHIFREQEIGQMLHIVDAVKASRGTVIGQAGSTLGATSGGKLGENASSPVIRRVGARDGVPVSRDRDGEHSGAGSRG